MTQDLVPEPDEVERLIVHAVRSMPLHPLPADFATQVSAQLYEEKSRPRWELILLYVLLLTLCVTGLVYLFASLDAGLFAGRPALAITGIGLYLMVQFSDLLARKVGVKTSDTGAHLR